MDNLTTQDRKTLDNYTGMTVGQILRRARKDRGYDLNDIASHLNIGSTHLEAIEAEDIKSLPPKVYAVGFVRAYADVLELDPEKMAYLFKIQFYGKSNTEHQKEMVRVDGKSISIQETLSQKDNILFAIISASFMAIAAITALIFFIVWLVTPSDKTGEITVPNVPIEMLEEKPALEERVQDDINIPESANIVEENVFITIQPEEGAVAYGADPLDSALAIKLVADSWMQIRDLKNGKILLTRTLKKGDVFYASESQEILLTAGNAGGVEVYLDGKTLGILGDEAEIVRNRPFSVEALRLQKAE